MESIGFIATEFFLQTLQERLIVLFGAKACLTVARAQLFLQTTNKTVGN